MKLIRFGDAGKEKPGVLLSDGSRLDASGFGSDYDEAFFERDGLAALRKWFDGGGSSRAARGFFGASGAADLPAEQNNLHWG